MKFNKISWQVLFGIFLTIFLVRSVMFPVIADDYSYAFIWDGEHGGNLIDGIGDRKRIESLADIFISQWSHYFTWGGRVLAHALAQFFIWIGKPFFDLVNTFVLTIFIFVVFKIGTGLKIREMNKIYLLWIFLGLWFGTPYFFQVTLWLTGACNYLWMYTLELIFLFPFILKYRHKNFWEMPPSWSIPFMVLAGFFAGASNESGSIGIIFLSFCLLIYFYRRNELKNWMAVGFLFSVIGFLFLIMAPGDMNQIKLAYGIESDAPLSVRMQWTPEMFLNRFENGFLPVVLQGVFLFLPIIFYFMQSERPEYVSTLIIMLTVSATVILLAMMFSPKFQVRSGIPATIFVLMASLAALKEISPILNSIIIQKKKLVNFIGTLMIFAWGLNVLGCLYVEYGIYDQLASRQKFIEQHREDDLIVVSPLSIPDWSEKYLGSLTINRLALSGSDLRNYPECYLNVMFAKYHGLKKIITSP